MIALLKDHKAWILKNTYYVYFLSVANTDKLVANTY